MAISWQRATLKAVGLAVGVAAGVAGLTACSGEQGAAGSAGATVGGPPAAGTAASANTAVVAAASECGIAPVLARKGSEDGQLSLQSKPSAASASEVSQLILGGKEAAAAGRDRDAEVAFLNACRNAALLQSEPIPAADAMYQLARHYANLAAFGTRPAEELYARAERFYSASVLTYTARYGTGHEKTRFATEGLKTVQQVTGGNGPVAVAKVEPPKPAPAPAARPATPPPVAQVEPPAPAAVARPATPPVVVSAPAPAPVAPPRPVQVAPAPAPAAPTQVAPAPASTPSPARSEAARTPAAPRSESPSPAPATPAREQRRATATAEAPAPAVPAAPAVQARSTSPSFDCARARSTTERLICADEDLARQDRELGRLHQRARQASADPRAFQRASDAQWQRREDTCRDRECLQRWYAQRRQDLAGAATAPAAPARAAPRVETAEPVQRVRPEPVQPSARATPERRDPTSAAGAGAVRPPPDEPTVRAPVLRAPPVRARVAEPTEQPAAPPATASGSVGDVPAAEGSPNAAQ